MSVAAQLQESPAQKANALYQDGRFEDSLAVVEAAMTDHSNDATLWFLKALNLRSLEKRNEAIPILEALYKEVPDNRDVWAALCLTLLEAKYIARAIEIGKQGVASHQSDIRYYEDLVNFLLGAFRFYEAQQVCLAAINLAPKDVKLWLKLSECFLKDEKVQKAAAALAEVKALAPTNYNLKFNYAEHVRRLGGKVEAEKAYRSLLKESFNPAVFLALSQVKKLDPNGLLVRKAKSAVNSTDFTTVEKSSLKFGIALAYDNASMYERAAEYYVAANRLRSETLPFDRDEQLAHLQSVKEAFTEEYCSQSFSGAATNAPIFIVGMPRSGSTLIEQVLSSHSLVEGVGEVNYINRLSLGSTPTPFAQEYVQYSEEQRKNFADNYIHLIRDACEFSHRFTDKNLFNWRKIGYILTSMPDAKIIHTRRDPRAGNLSIFKLPYSENVAFSASASHLKWFRKQYEDMMAFWEERFPGRILHIDYEDTVLDLEGQARRVLAYLDLPWEAQVLAFHENKRAAVTASYDQVRQKLYQSSLEPWKVYEGTKLAEELGF